MSERLGAYRYWQDLVKESKSNGLLNGKGYSVCSMHDQDGIIAEIFNIIGTKSKRFIEFGCGDGMQNNTLFPLTFKDWSGFWIDGDKDQIDGAMKRMPYYRNAENLDVLHELINAENIDDILRKYSEDKNNFEYDLMVIDVDWNDSYVWESIHSIKPRVICIEYNSHIPPDISLRVPYNKEVEYAVWTGKLFFGSSLLAMNDIAKKIGYTLVGCSLAGSDAFFVKDEDLEQFNWPYTGLDNVQYSYEPPRFDLCFNLGHQSHPWANEEFLELTKNEIRNSMAEKNEVKLSIDKRPKI